MGRGEGVLGQTNQNVFELWQEGRDAAGADLAEEDGHLAECEQDHVLVARDVLGLQMGLRRGER